MGHDPLSPLPRQTPPHDPPGRRALLATAPNPEPGLDYLVVRHRRLSWPGNTLLLRLRYVPDRLILAAEGWTGYTNVIAEVPATSLEALTATILSDLANELVPRWLEVTMEGSQGDEDDQGDRSGVMEGHRVVLQERQPQWPASALPGLLASA